MDGIRSHAGDDCRSSGGIPLRDSLFGYFAKEPAATEVDGFKCSSKSLKYDAAAESPGRTSPGFFFAEQARAEVPHKNLSFRTGVKPVRNLLLLCPFRRLLREKAGRRSLIFESTPSM